MTGFRAGMVVNIVGKGGGELEEWLIQATVHSNFFCKKQRRLLKN